MTNLTGTHPVSRVKVSVNCHLQRATTDFNIPSMYTPALGADAFKHRLSYAIQRQWS